MAQRPQSRLLRAAWFVGLYAVSLAAFTVVVYALRAMVPR